MLHYYNGDLIANCSQSYSSVHEMHVNALSNSFVLENKLSFENIDNSSGFNLNSKIIALWLQVYFYDIDNKLINENVFERTEFIQFSGIITSIDKNMFRFLKNISILSFNLNDLLRFFHVVGIEWAFS